MTINSLNLANYATILKDSTNCIFRGVLVGGRIVCVKKDDPAIRRAWYKFLAFFCLLDTRQTAYEKKAKVTLDWAQNDSSFQQINALFAQRHPQVAPSHSSASDESASGEEDSDPKGKRPEKHAENTLSKQEINDLRDENADLKLRIINAETVQEEIEREHAELLRQNEQFEKDLAAYNAECQRFASIADRLKETLQTTVSEKDEQISYLKNAASENQEQTEKLSAELEAAKASQQDIINDRNERISDANEKIAAFQKTADESNANIQELTANLLKAQSQLDVLANEKKELEQQISDADSSHQGALANLQKEIAQKGQEVDRQQGEISALQKSLDSEIEKSKAANEAVDTLKGQIASLEEEKQELISKYEASISEKAALSAELTKVKGENENLVETLNAGNICLSKKEEEHKSVLEKFEEKMKQLTDKLSRRKAKLTKEREHAAAAKENAEAELAEARKEIVKHKSLAENYARANRGIPTFANSKDLTGTPGGSVIAPPPRSLTEQEIAERDEVRRQFSLGAFNTSKSSTPSSGSLSANSQEG